MENQYGIAVKNKYDLFLDEDCDPLEILRMTEEAKQKAKADKSKKDAKNEKTKSGKTKLNKKPVTPVQEQPKGVDVNANKKDGMLLWSYLCVFTIACVANSICRLF